MSAAPEQAMSELQTAFMAWDWSSAFPVGYGGTKAPILVDAWPFDLIDNMLTETDGVMTQPVISLVLAVDDDRPRTFGDLQFGQAPGAGLTRYGMGVDLGFAVGCWADERMGGGPMVKRLVGLVQGCVFVYRNRLTSFRHLKCRGGQEVYEERPQLWRADLTVMGDGVNIYDA